MLSLLNPKAETIRRGQALQVDLLFSRVLESPTDLEGEHHRSGRSPRCPANKPWPKGNHQNARRWSRSNQTYQRRKSVVIRDGIIQ